MGHAIEFRVNAENPVNFRPSPGRIDYYHPPGGLGVRVDSAVYQGYTIPPNYDSLIGKLIVHGRTRNECLMRLRRALDEFVVAGIDTTLPLFRSLVRNADIPDAAAAGARAERGRATLEPKFGRGIGHVLDIREPRGPDIGDEVAEVAEPQLCRNLLHALGQRLFTRQEMVFASLDQHDSMVSI